MLSMSLSSLLALPDPKDALALEYPSSSYDGGNRHLRGFRFKISWCYNRRYLLSRIFLLLENKVIRPIHVSQTITILNRNRLLSIALDQADNAQGSLHCLRELDGYRSYHSAAERTLVRWRKSKYGQVFEPCQNLGCVTRMAFLAKRRLNIHMIVQVVSQFKSDCFLE